MKHCHDFINVWNSDLERKKYPLTIPMPYLTWSLHILENKTQRYPITFNKKRTEFSIYTPTSIIDIAKMKTVFPSIFIHGIDAYGLYMIQSQINKKMREANHDCFGVNLIYSLYL